MSFIRSFRNDNFVTDFPYTNLNIFQFGTVVTIEDLIISRSGIAISPLDSYNYSDGKVYATDEPIMLYRYDHDDNYYKDNYLNMQGNYMVIVDGKVLTKSEG